MKRDHTTRYPLNKGLFEQQIPGPSRITGEPAIPGAPLPEIVILSTYPPRECGIATYTQDLVKALTNKYDQSFSISLCALESDTEKHLYTDKVKFILNTDEAGSFVTLAKQINEDPAIRLVLIQHEFGLFRNAETDFSDFLRLLRKPVLVVFHTVLPHPDEELKQKVQDIAHTAAWVIVMTRASAKVLAQEYAVDRKKISVIPHGTHLVQQVDRSILKARYQLAGKMVLSTFGLLSSGKSIETTLDAMPAILSRYPDVLFLIIGKTHPAVVKQEGEVYRIMLEKKVETLQLQQHVRFINSFLPLNELLEYLQLTDIYLFTSKNPNQAVSGTFSLAISCGCPVISTPIPHAREVLQKETGIIIGFEAPGQLANAVTDLLGDGPLREKMGLNALHRMASTAWENAAISHARLFERTDESGISLHYRIPSINLAHLKKMTTDFGIVQFARISQPDISSGYTLDDNARALIAMCQHFDLTREADDIAYIRLYLDFIGYCQQDNGYFLNYIDKERKFTDQNQETNLEDSNGRAIWALGYLISLAGMLPAELGVKASFILARSLPASLKMNSPRAMAFAIKGLYYSRKNRFSEENTNRLVLLADRLVQMYRHEAENGWEWFESYLTYANSILPEAMICAWLTTLNDTYRKIARSSFDFLLSRTFSATQIKPISNRTWLQKTKGFEQTVPGGEQPIDAAYTILALGKFYDVFIQEEDKRKMRMAFDWFLGANHLHQIMYNPCSGGCYDGLEKNEVNLNQGAESTLSYLMARLAIEKIIRNEQTVKKRLPHFLNPAVLEDQLLN